MAIAILSTQPIPVRVTELPVRALMLIVSVFMPRMIGPLEFSLFRSSFKVDLDAAVRPRRRGRHEGGTLAAHASLAACEYGIPAVVVTGDATSRLSDGQRVTVDGRRRHHHPHA